MFYFITFRPCAIRSFEMILNLTLKSIHGQATSIEDTEKVMKGFLPTNDGEENTYRVAYAVHKILEPIGDSLQGESRPAEQEKVPTEFIGHVNLVSFGASNLVLPEHLTLPAEATTTTLTLELAYSFLPSGWGTGYATESVNAVLESCRRARSFWAPFLKLYIRAIVNEGNPASMRVMEKTGMVKRGVYELNGKPVFLAGEWRDQHILHIFGRHLLE